MAKVIYVPVMHSSIAMGSAVSAYQVAFVARFREPKWAERTGEVDVIRQAIETAIAAVGLRGDETGVLFRGALHQLARFLPAGISVEYLTVQTP